jgi:beta-galactosidase
MKNLKLLFNVLIIAIPAMMSAQTQNHLPGINNSWTFHGKSISGDSIHEIVSIPHTWNSYDAVNGFDYYRGKGMYQKTISIPKDISGKRVFLRFGAVQSVADVYLNNIHLGQHRGGYSAFIFEVTPYVKTDSANTIRVVADNTRYEDVLPLGGDFNIFGGITQPVELFTTSNICISPMDFASSGVYLTQKSVSDEEAKIDEELLMSNGFGTEKAITILTTVFDASGQTVFSSRREEKMLPGETKSFRQTFSVLKPHLWNGKADPYLYRFRTQVFADGKLADEVNQPLGIRYFSVDPDKGFFLNGKHLPLHGVGRHQDFGGKASAMSEADHKTDLALMLEMGVNAVRCTHYQHDDYFHSLLDSSGIITWAEIPFVGSLMGGYTNSDSFRENARQQLTELIKQNYNHPSICFWGIFNELSHSKKNSPVEEVKSLTQLAEKLDPARLTTAASFSKDKDSLNFITSLIAWNKYFGWYYGTPEMAGTWADHVHKTYPGLKIAISEYGAGGNILQHDEKIKRPFPISHYYAPEEFQAECHEGFWAEIVQRPFIWGSFLWNMFDFSVAFRNEGDTPARNNKGMVTYDRKEKKDVFYFYKANWNPDPMVYICNKRFLQRTSLKTHVKVYSNAESVELFVNGESQGTREGKNAVFKWEKVMLTKGNNSVKAVATGKSNKIEDSCVWYVSKTSGIKSLIWFLRVGIKPFIALCILIIAFLVFKARKLPRKTLTRRLIIILSGLIALILVILLAAFVFGKMNGINIFEYSVI